jgi:hypothetical protein
MAQDIGYDFAAGPTVTLLSSNLVDGSSSALTAAVDLGNPTPVGLGMEIKLDAQASADDFADIEVFWSHDNTDFSNGANPDIAYSFNCTASTVGIAITTIPVKARYLKFRITNNSGGTINSASTALILTDVFYNQV